MHRYQHYTIIPCKDLFITQLYNIQISALQNYTMYGSQHYSQTCVKQPLKGSTKSGYLGQVAA